MARKNQKTFLTPGWLKQVILKWPLRHFNHLATRIKQGVKRRLRAGRRKKVQETLREGGDEKPP